MEFPALIPTTQESSSCSLVWFAHRLSFTLAYLIFFRNGFRANFHGLRKRFTACYVLERSPSGLHKFRSFAASHCARDNVMGGKYWRDDHHFQSCAHHCDLVGSEISTASR